MNPLLEFRFNEKSYKRFKKLKRIIKKLKNLTKSFISTTVGLLSFPKQFFIGLVKSEKSFNYLS